MVSYRKPLPIFHFQTDKEGRLYKQIVDPGCSYPYTVL